MMGGERRELTMVGSNGMRWFLGLTAIFDPKTVDLYMGSFCPKTVDAYINSLYLDPKTVDPKTVDLHVLGMEITDIV